MEEYYETIKKRIIERKDKMELYYSKLEIREKLDYEIKQLKEEIEVLDRNITTLTPPKKPK